MFISSSSYYSLAPKLSLKMNSVILTFKILSITNCLHSPHGFTVTLMIFSSKIVML